MENFRNEHPGALFSVSFQVVQVLTTVASSRLSVSPYLFYYACQNSDTAGSEKLCNFGINSNLKPSGEGFGKRR